MTAEVYDLRAYFDGSWARTKRDPEIAAHAVYHSFCAIGIAADPEWAKRFLEALNELGHDVVRRS